MSDTPVTDELATVRKVCGEALQRIRQLERRNAALEMALKAMTDNFRLSLVLVNDKEGRALGMELIADAQKVLVDRIVCPYCNPLLNINEHDERVSNER